MQLGSPQNIANPDKVMSEFEIFMVSGDVVGVFAAGFGLQLDRGKFYDLTGEHFSDLVRAASVQRAGSALNDSCRDR